MGSSLFPDITGTPISDSSSESPNGDGSSNVIYDDDTTLDSK